MARAPATKTKKKKGAKAPKLVVEVQDDSWGAKHRPKAIADLILSPTNAALLDRLMTKLPRSGALLVTGPSGTGKTTIAGILAQALSRGHAADVVEFNCSTDGVVDKVRDLIAETRYMPRHAKGSRAVIVDEVQALVGTGGDKALKALLGPLEDKSGPVFWILCTDQPHVLPATITSRVQRLELSLPKVEQVSKRLRTILKAEGNPIKWPEEQIGKLCDAVVATAPFNIRMACNNLQTAVSTIEGMKLNGPKMTYKKAVEAGMVLSGVRAKAEVAAASDLLMKLAEKKADTYNVVCRTIRGADPNFVVDAMIEAASVATENSTQMGHSWAEYCGMALWHLLAHKDAAYARAGQAPIERTARLQATLFRIYRDSNILHMGGAALEQQKFFKGKA
jgi:DNA polymerase III delta prime subunit